MGTGSAIGIEAIHSYIGPAFVDVRELFVARGLDLSRFDNLMMRRKSVNLPCEDPVTNAVNAARPLLAELDEDARARIELLVVATESGLDLGKPISTYVHHHLGLGNACRSFEVKHACYGGTAALQTAAAMIATSPVPGALALVIATDAPGTAARGTTWEPAEGAGAVAMLVGAPGRILRLDPGGSGFHTFEVLDTARPRADVDVVNADASLLAYMTCLEKSFEHYCQRVAGADLRKTFGHLVMHTPFPGMVRGGHRLLMRKKAAAGAAEIDRDFTERVAPSLEYCADTGNLFSGALYLAVCSLLDHARLDGPERVGLFSYGSGCASEFFSGVVGHEPPVRRGIDRELADRYALTVAEYDRITGMADDRGFGTRDALFDTGPYAAAYERRMAGRGLLVLDRIDAYRRTYRWS
ncbi:hydroxymethylglutaryl-CoA synthase family protein [Streptomyces sp. NPDC002596]